MKKIKAIILSAIAVIANVVYYFVLKTKLYTDQYYLPDEQLHTWQRSPADTLYSANLQGLLYWQMNLAIVSVIASVLVLCGVKIKAVQIIQIVSIIASAVLFVTILVIAGGVHLTY